MSRSEELCQSFHALRSSNNNDRDRKFNSLNKKIKKIPFEMNLNKSFCFHNWEILEKYVEGLQK